MGEVVTLDVVKKPEPGVHLVSFALMREVNIRLTLQGNKAGYIHLRDAETGTMCSVYADNGSAVKWAMQGPCTEDEAFSLACKFETGMRRILRPYR